MNSVDTSMLSSTPLPLAVLGLCRTLRAAGRRGWIVGGCVRDLLLGRPVSDWDLATDALPTEVQRIFPRTIPTGLAHGTVTVLQGGASYELTTLRGEGTYSDGRRPDAVTFVDDLTLDLARRDFTVNAIALDPLEGGGLIDPFGGQQDLSARVLRAVGDPVARFSEDGLRGLRAARFVATLDFSLEPATERAIGMTLQTYCKVSAERVRDEWLKALRAVHPSRAFEVMRRTGILAITCPELVAEGEEASSGAKAWRQSMARVDACVGDPVLRLAALLFGLGQPVQGAELMEQIALRLKLSGTDCTRLVQRVQHRFDIGLSQGSDTDLRRWVGRVGLQSLPEVYALAEADLRAQTQGKELAEKLAALQSFQARMQHLLQETGIALSIRELQVKGGDLIHGLGIRPGPQVGELLARLLEEVLCEPALNTREGLLQRAGVLVHELESGG